MLEAPTGAWPYGICIQNGADNTVQLNRIIGYSGNTYGMILDGANGNLVKKNTIQNCQIGISLGFPTSVENAKLTGPVGATFLSRCRPRVRPVIDRAYIGVVVGRFCEPAPAPLPGR